MIFVPFFFTIWRNTTLYFASVHFDLREKALNFVALWLGLCKVEMWFTNVLLLLHIKTDLWDVGLLFEDPEEDSIWKCRSFFYLFLMNTDSWTALPDSRLKPPLGRCLSYFPHSHFLFLLGLFLSTCGFQTVHRCSQRHFILTIPC